MIGGFKPEDFRYPTATLCTRKATIELPREHFQNFDIIPEPSRATLLHASRVLLLESRRRLVREGYGDVLNSLSDVNSLIFDEIPRKYHRLHVTTPAITIRSPGVLATIDNQMFFGEAKNHFVCIESMQDHPAKRLSQVSFSWALPSSESMRGPYPPNPNSAARTIFTLVRYCCVLIVVQRGLDMKLPVSEYDKMTFALRRLRSSDGWQQTHGVDANGMAPYSGGLQSHTSERYHAPMPNAQHAGIPSSAPDSPAKPDRVYAISTQVMLVTQPEATGGFGTRDTRSSQLGYSTEPSKITVQSAEVPEDDGRSNMSSDLSETMSVMTPSETDRAIGVTPISHEERVRACKTANLPPGPAALQDLRSLVSAEVLFQLPVLEFHKVRRP